MDGEAGSQNEDSVVEESAVEEASSEAVETSNEETTTESPETPAEPSKPKAKKSAAKKVASKPVVAKAAKKSSITKAVKAAKKAPAEKESKPAKEKSPPRKDGLTGSQVKVLTALLKKPLNGKEISEKTGIHPTAVGNIAGYRNPEINSREVHAGNLLNKKLVRIMIPEEGERGFRYEITAAGKKVIQG